MSTRPGTTRPPITVFFSDLKERNDKARSAAEERVSMLEQQGREDEGLPLALEKELAVQRALIARDDDEQYVQAVVDPLFIGLRDAIGATHPDMNEVPYHQDGEYQRNQLTPDTRLLVALYGLLAVANEEPRDFAWKLEDGHLTFETSDSAFQKAVTAALGEYTTSADLFSETFSTLALVGRGTLNSAKWATVVKKLESRGIEATHPNLGLLTSEVLADEIGGGDGAAPSSVDLSFPVIEEASSNYFVRNNIIAMHIWYPSWMLEQAYFYDVYDKIEELFLNQLLPVSRGTAGDKIYARWKKSTQRISKAERLNFYASCFGAPGGNPAIPNQNVEFADIWLRFVSGVSEWGRKLNVDDLLRTRIPLSVSTEQVRKSARDAAGNLSLHGYGVAYNGAAEIQQEISEIKDILSDPEIRLSYGARDMRQLIEQVSIYELGGARDVTRYFTMATAGAIIIRWLANKSTELSGPYLRPILDVNVVRKPTMRSPTVKATTNPTDRDLVDACEQWLAVTGTSGDRVSEYAQPSETAAMTSRPVSIPQVARDLLDSVGIAAGVGAGNGGGSRFTTARR